MAIAPTFFDAAEFYERAPFNPLLGTLELEGAADPGECAPHTSAALFNAPPSRAMTTPAMARGLDGRRHLTSDGIKGALAP